MSQYKERPLHLWGAQRHCILLWQHKGTIQWLWKGINILTSKAHLGVWMYKSLRVKLKWAVCECTQKVQSSLAEQREDVPCELQMIDANHTEWKKRPIHNPTQALTNSRYTCLSNPRQVTHTSSTWDWMWPHTINNNRLHSLKDFPRQKCSPYQYCP